MLNKAIFTLTVAYTLFTFNIVTVFGHAGMVHVRKVTPENYNIIAQRMMESQRIQLLQPERIVDVMQIKPDMTILDVGAGVGLFTFLFSKALNGTGRVYATEIDKDMLDQISTKMNELKINNIVPVKVSPEGLDPFYTQHSYDIIFLCGVYHHMWDHENYFRKLKPALHDNGRLFIIESAEDSDFNEIFFSNFMEVMRVFHEESDRFPFFQKLGKRSQEFIKNWREDKDVPPEIRSAIVEDLNKMLLDRRLLYDLLDYYYAEGHSVPWKFLYEQRSFYGNFQLIHWLTVELDEAGVFGREEKILTDLDKERIHKLNKMLINGVFRPYRWDWQYGLIVFYKKASILATLQSAGYHLVREFDFLESYYFLEFEKNAQ